MLSSVALRFISELNEALWFPNLALLMSRLLSRHRFRRLFHLLLWPGIWRFEINTRRLDNRPCFLGSCIFFLSLGCCGNLAFFCFRLRLSPLHWACNCMIVLQCSCLRLCGACWMAENTGRWFWEILFPRLFWHCRCTGDCTRSSFFFCSVCWMWPVVVHSEACMYTHFHLGLFGILVLLRRIFLCLMTALTGVCWCLLGYFGVWPVGEWIWCSRICIYIFIPCLEKYGQSEARITVANSAVCNG